MLLVTVTPLAVIDDVVGAPMVAAASLIVHFECRVMSAVIAIVKTNAVVRPGSEYQPAKVLPVLVGSTGTAAAVLTATIWLPTTLPPLLSKLTV